MKQMKNSIGVVTYDLVPKRRRLEKLLLKSVDW